MPRTLNRRTALGLMAGAAVGGALAACASNENPPAAGGLPVIRWGLFRIYQPTYIGIEKGFFREAGVNVEITGLFSSGPAVVQAAGTGQVDAGHSATTGIAGAVAAGVKVSGIADSQTEFTDAPLQQWFVLKDSPIQSVADLKGKRIGTNGLSGSFYYTTLIALKDAGLRKEDVQFVNLNHDKQGQALMSKQIDICGVIDPYSIQLGKEPSARRLFTGADILGNKQFSLVFFSKDFIEKNREAVRKFMTGYLRAIAYIRANPDESSSIMAAKIGLKPTDVVRHRYLDNAAIRPDDAQFWVDVMRENGELKDAPGLKGADLLDASFNA